jgi:hypothetical protein
VKRTLYFLLPISQIFLLSPAFAGNNIPAWKIPKPGTEAFLGVNGNHSESVIICKTISDFYKRENSISGHPRGCEKFHSGVLVIIQGLQYDPDSIFSGGYSMPIVKIKIPSKNFTGYTYLDKGIQPKIPYGSEISIKSSGNLTFRLAHSKEDLSGIGQKFSSAFIKIVRQDQDIGFGGRNLYVTIISQKNKGKSGWIFGQSENTTDGTPITQFEYAVLSPHQTIPKSYLIPNTAPTISASLHSQQNVPPFGVPRGNSDFHHFVDYYAQGNYVAGAAVHCGLKGKAWGQRVRLETLRLLFARSIYDYPLETHGKAEALKPAVSQINASIKAGLHVPLSACAGLKVSSGYSLADSLATLISQK